MTDTPMPPPGDPPPPGPGATPPGGYPPGGYQPGPPPYQAAPGPAPGGYPPGAYPPGAYQSAGYQPGYPGAPMAAPPSNGMAVAALVCGILTYVCLGPVAAILAIVFGFIGLSKSREINVGRGMSIAGIVLGAVGLVASVVAIIALIALGSAASNLDNISGPADPSTYEVTPGTCSVNSIGVATFSGTIKNTTSSSKNFDVEGEIRNKANGALVDTSSDLVTDIPAGDTAQWTITSSAVDSEMQISCKVSEVDDWFN